MKITAGRNGGFEKGGMGEWENGVKRKRLGLGV